MLACLPCVHTQAMLYAPFETAQASVQLLLGSTIDTKSVIVENTMYSITATRMILVSGTVGLSKRGAERRVVQQSMEGGMQ